MGCYDGAEVCELVGIYILNKLSNIIDIDSIGLYRDDGLGTFESLCGSKIEGKKKNVTKVFKMCGLSIISTTNITSADFLDVTFNLKTESYQPFRKPNMNVNTLTSALIISRKSSSNFQNQLRKDYPKYRHLRKYLIIQNTCKKKLYKRTASKKNLPTKGCEC